MKQYISMKLAGNVLIISNVLIIVLHLFILFGLLPYSMFWRDQIIDDGAIMKYEIAAIIVSLLFIASIIIKVEYIKQPKLKEISNLILWIMLMYLIISTVGNFTMGISMDILFYIPITLTLSVFTYRLASEK